MKYLSKYEKYPVRILFPSKKSSPEFLILEEMSQDLLNWQFLNPQAPVAQKMRMRWFFDISKVKESSFFLNRTSLTPHQIFDAHLLVNTDLSPSRFHFSVGFISRSCFESDGFIAYSNE